MQRNLIFLILVVICILAVSQCIDADCSLPKDAGMCRGLLPRFWFNADTKQCETFNWGGCGGNGNNFASLEECQKECVV